MNSSFKNTRHFIQNQERSLDNKGWYLNNGAKDLFRTTDSLHAHNINLLRNAYIGMLTILLGKVTRTCRGMHGSHGVVNPPFI